MTGIVEIKKQIRRALESPLYLIAKAQTPVLPVLWNGVGADMVNGPNKKPVPRWVAAAIGYGSIEILEMGPTPRFKANVTLTMVVRTPVAGGADQNDNLSALVVGGYPYASEAVFDGVTVYIDKAVPGAYGVDRAWLYSEVSAYCTCYRR
jgi:hypothetical protein